MKRHSEAREVQLVVVGAPGGPLDLVRDAEERPVGINLGGVGAQRVVTHLQEVAHIDTRGEQAVLALVVALEHLLELLTGLSLLTKVPSDRREPLPVRSEEHTSELQSRGHLVCRLLLEKKNQTNTPDTGR